MSVPVLKRLEQIWKRGLIAGVAGLAGGGVRPVPDWRSREWRVLYLRPDRIGDMILATSLIRAIARSHPTIRLDVLASPANAQILRGSPWVRRVRLFRRDRPRTWPALVRELRRARYDVVIDPMVLSPSVTTMLLMHATGAPYRIGVGGKANAALFTLPVPPTPIVDAHHVEHSAALATPFGVDPLATDWRPEIALDDNERTVAEDVWRRAGATNGDRRLLVNVSAGKARRHWPDECYAAVVRHARARHPRLCVLVIGAPPERENVARIARESEVAGEVPGLREAIALVAASHAVFTPDTSVVHAASAFGVPVVTMVPRGYGALFGPYRTPGVVIASPGTTLTELPLQPALDGIDTLLAEVERVG